VSTPTPIPSLVLPFPLRRGFIAQIIIPRYMSKDEAKRLCAFIQSLAHEPARSDAEAADKT
jgi:hypothetical protein